MRSTVIQDTIFTRSSECSPTFSRSIMTKLAIAAVLLSSLFAAAQNPVSDAARNTFTGRSKNLLGAAEEMPADKYSFKPTEAQRTFAGWVQHTVEMNNGACAKL